MIRSFGFSLVAHGLLGGLAFFAIARSRPEGLARLAATGGPGGATLLGELTRSAPLRKKGVSAAGLGASVVSVEGAVKPPVMVGTGANLGSASSANVASAGNANTGSSGGGTASSSGGASVANPGTLTLRTKYPRASRALGEEGEVGVRAVFSPSGAVLAVSLTRSSGFSRLDEAALDAARKATVSFAAPPLAPVPRELRIVFRLNDSATED